LFEFGEEAFDAPSLFVGEPVGLPLYFPVATRGNNGFTALLLDEFDQAVGVIGSVGRNLFGGQVSDEITRRGHVVFLSWAEFKADGEPQGVYDGVDLGSEAPSGSPESLGFRSPLFRRDPAA
jgi:hypothetical protein